MIQLNDRILQEFEKRDLRINEGITADYDEPLGHRAVDVCLCLI